MTDALVDPLRFGGEPGEFVPDVDPEDLKATWELQQDVQARHPGKQIATGAGLVESLCKPGANIQAVAYRTMVVWMMIQFAAEGIVPYLKDGVPTDVVFRATAKVRLEWMGVGVVRQGPPFDVNEFLRLCAGNTDELPEL